MQKTQSSLNLVAREKLVQSIASFLQQNCKEIAAAYVFGSFVTEGPFADIDLGILTAARLEKALDFELDLENRLEKIIKIPVDVRILNAAPLSFAQNVIRYGRVILDYDPSLRADFEGLVLKKYFDFSYFRRRYLEEVVNAPI